MLTWVEPLPPLSSLIASSPAWLFRWLWEFPCPWSPNCTRQLKHLFVHAVQRSGAPHMASVTPEFILKLFWTYSGESLACPSVHTHNWMHRNAWYGGGKKKKLSKSRGASETEGQASSTSMQGAKQDPSSWDTAEPLDEDHQGCSTASRARLVTGKAVPLYSPHFHTCSECQQRQTLRSQKPTKTLQKKETSLQSKFIILPTSSHTSCHLGTGFFLS